MKYCGCNYYVKNNLYFTHIAKTGGTFLLRNFMEKYSIYKQHITLKDVENKIGFTIIRNPCDWYLSNYYYSKNQSFKNLPFIKKNIDLEGFMNIMLNPYSIDINLCKTEKHPFYKFLIFIIEHCKLEIGFYTVEYIWRTCFDYNILLTSNSINELEKNIIKKNSIKYWLKTNTLDKELPIFLKEHFNIQVSNIKKYNKYSSKYGNEKLTEEMKHLIKKKDKIIFNRHYS